MEGEALSGADGGARVPELQARSWLSEVLPFPSPPHSFNRRIPLYLPWKEHLILVPHLPHRSPPE